MSVAKQDEREVRPVALTDRILRRAAILGCDIRQRVFDVLDQPLDSDFVAARLTVQTFQQHVSEDPMTECSDLRGELRLCRGRDDPLRSNVG